MASDEPMDADDNLFEFDELFEGEEPAASAPGPDAPAGAAPEVRLEPRTAAPEAFDEREREVLEPRVAQGGLPPIVVPLLLVMALANLALVGLTWKSLRGAPASAGAPGAAAGELGAPETPAARSADAPQLARPLARALPSLPASRDDAWAALAGAERALDAGEFVAARRALYSSLTVIDRVEAAERRELESRGSFLIAESYRRQAEALPLTGEPR